MGRAAILAGKEPSPGAICPSKDGRLRRPMAPPLGPMRSILPDTCNQKKTIVFTRSPRRRAPRASLTAPDAPRTIGVFERTRHDRRQPSIPARRSAGRPSQADRLEPDRGACARAERWRVPRQDPLYFARPRDAGLDERGPVLYRARRHRRGDAGRRRRSGRRLETCRLRGRRSCRTASSAFRNMRSRTGTGSRRSIRVSRRCRSTSARSACRA